MQVLTVGTSMGLLLIPIGMVAQVVSRSETQELQTDLPFARNQIMWRDLQLPLLFSSEMLGGDSGSDDAYQRVVIVWPMQGADRTQLFGFSSLDSPITVSIDKSASYMGVSDLSRKHGTDLTMVSLGALNMGDQIGVIPNLKNISDSLFS